MFSVLFTCPAPLLLVLCLWTYSWRTSQFDVTIMNKIKICLTFLYFVTIVPGLFVDILETFFR